EIASVAVQQLRLFICILHKPLIACSFLNTKTQNGFQEHMTIRLCVCVCVCVCVYVCRGRQTTQRQANKGRESVCVSVCRQTDTTQGEANREREREFECVG